ncbi:hypothetical protein BS50DRAFT_575915 [Corynespora cassiicola Philippines]|uniref:Uncharacterized protein n=1 Tax=Corynespora cassiicola Philippines TaxID=1448308 RepID=A0A2T2NGA8_CORCC|nr:hypothetical protein BS50DRAFT_575915 [Corynespora cassiicola Philippines]
MPHDGQALRHRIQGLLHRNRKTVRIADVSASGEAVRHCTRIRSHTLFTHTTVAVRSWLRPVPWRQVGGVEITRRMLPSHCFIVFLRPVHQGTTLHALCLSDAGSLRIDVILLILAISFQCRGFSPSLHMHIGSAKSHRAFPNKQKASHSPRCLILFACFGIYPKLSHWQRRLTDLYRQVVAWRIPMSVLLKPRGSCFVFLRLACLYQCSDWDALIFRIVITLWACFWRPRGSPRSFLILPFPSSSSPSTTCNS